MVADTGGQQARPRASPPGCRLTSAPPTGAGTPPTTTSSRAAPSSRLIEGLRKADSVIRSAGAPQGLVDQASGYRHLLVLLALGIDEALRHSDPYDPHFGPANVDNVLKWGMDCPDAAYTGAAVRGDATYRVRGNRQPCAISASR